MELDEALRARLSRIAQGEDLPDLDDLGTARIARRIAAEAERRNAPLFRGAWAALAYGLLPAITAALVLWGLANDSVESPPPACAAAPAPRDRDAAPERLDFGARALAVAEPGAEVRVARAESCAIRLDLARGRVTVHARDLGGGELRVRTGAVDAVVHGTVFAVEHAADGAVAVDVVEGRVTGERGGSEIASAHAGQRFTVRGAKVQTVPLGEAARTAMRAALVAGVPAPVRVPVAPAAPVAPPAAARDATVASPAAPVGTRAQTLARSRAPKPARIAPAELLSRAREAAQARDYDDARSLYREAGSGRVADAEAAWLDLARLEIEQARPQAARDALRERERRFGNDSALALEAANAEFRLERAAGNREAAIRVARRISARWPGTPYAAKARRWLEQEKDWVR